MQHDERGDPVAHGARLFDLLDSIVSRDFMELGIWIMVDAQSESPPYDHNALQRAVDFLDQHFDGGHNDHTNEVCVIYLKLVLPRHDFIVAVASHPLPIFACRSCVKDAGTCPRYSTLVL